jgi:hypothetical protein
LPDNHTLSPQDSRKTVLPNLQNGKIHQKLVFNTLALVDFLSLSDLMKKMSMKFKL